MIKRTKKLIAMIVASSVLSTSVLAAADTVKKGFQDIETDKYLITKISNTEAGPGQVDGILTGEDQDRGNSYTWSMIEYGDYIYIGTCYNPISGIYYRNLVNNFVSAGMSKEKAQEVAKAVLDLAYNGAMYYEEELNSVILKVNKKTYEPSVVYRADKTISGYRMVSEFDGKLYFAEFGASSALLEIDPENNDAAKTVYYSKTTDYSLACGIRGLVAIDGEVIMSLITDKGAKIISSSNPSSGEWTEIANQETFLDYPGCRRIDGAMGGGIWDIVEYNDSVYVTMVTSKTDPQTMVTNKQGFAMFKGDKDGAGNWTWTEIIGDKDNGAQYGFGLGVKESTCGNLFVYNGYLYIGNYNDPMLSLSEIPDKGSFENLYNDFKNPINLYRMDENLNIEMVGGQANDEFPTGPIGNMGVGLGNNTNQYVWRMGDHNGKLYIGTYDSATISNMFTNLTNGEIVNMSKEEFLRRIEQIKKLLESLMSKESKLKHEVEVENDEDINDSVEVTEELLGNKEIIEEQEDKVVVEDEITEVIDENEVIDKDDLEEATEEITEIDEEVKDETIDSEGDKEEQVEVETPLLDNQDEIESLLSELELFAEELDEIPQLTARASDTTSVVIYNKIMKIYEGLKPILPEEVCTIIDKLLEELNIKNFAYYWGLNEYAIKSVKGFDLLVSEDGVNFEILTNDGFGDEYNHGVRAFASTDEGFFIGAANPFYGAQLWLLSDKTMEPVEPEAPTDPEVPVDPEEPIDPEVPVEPVNPEKPSDENNSGSNGKDDGKGNLPNTGGVDSNVWLTLATALTIGGGLCLRKKNKK